MLGLFIAMILVAIGIYFGFATAAFKSRGVKRKALFIGGWIVGLFFILAASSLLNLSISGSNNAGMVYIVASIIIYVVKRKKSSKTITNEEHQ